MSLPLPPLSPPRSPRRDLLARPMSPHRYPGVYDELLSPPRRSVDPPLGARYPPRNNGPPPGYPPIGSKPVPPLIPPQNEPPPGYRARFDGPPFEDIPPGVEPPIPGFENSPFEKPVFGISGPMERERLLPSNFRDPYRAPYSEGPPVYRDTAGIPPVQNEIPPHVVDHPQRYRDNFRPPGHGYRDQGPVPFRDGQSFREPGPQQPYRDGNFRNGPPPLFRDSNYRNNMFRESNFRDSLPHNFRDTGVPYRAPSAEVREPNATPYDSTFREGYREEVNPNRDMRSGQYRSNNRNRTGSRRNPNVEHDRHRDGRDRDRFNENRGDQTERNERSRDVDKRGGFEKGREIREDRVRDYEKNREEKERENRGYDKSSPEKKLRTSPKRGREPRERKRSDSRDRSRDHDHRREKKEERTRDKSSGDRSREHKEKDKKIKDRKKKKREKEKDIEKKKKRDRKDKKEKDGVKKEDDDVEKSDLKQIIKEEMNEVDNVTAITQVEQEVQKLDNSIIEASKSAESQQVQDDLYGGEEAEAVDKEIIQNYVKTEEKKDITETKIIDTTKEEPFDGIELQPASDELEGDIEVASNNKEMLAPLPALSKWEVDDDTIEKAKEPGEITSPEEEEDSAKVTSEVLKRAENAIFAKAINSLRPIEIKKISSDRIKLYGDEGQQKNSVNNIQITVPVTDQEQRIVDVNDRKRRYSKTPPPRLSVKERLGGKVDDIRRSREPRVVQSTVERVKSRSKTPKKEQMSYRRVIVEKDRSRKSEQITRIEISKSERHNAIEGSKSDQHYIGNELRKRDLTKAKDEKKSFGDEKKVSGNQEKNYLPERKKSHERERKKSTLDEAHFEPDYDENVESDNEAKDESKKRERSQEISPTGPSDSKKVKLDETIKLDLANVKKKPDSDSESSSDSEYSSSSSSSDARKRKKKKKRSKKKKKRAASDSDSDSESSSDDHKKKKKKRKHKKKSSKKKKKYKHK